MQVGLYSRWQSWVAEAATESRVPRSAEETWGREKKAAELLLLLSFVCTVLFVPLFGC
jgi:hypothetical protein